MIKIAILDKQDIFREGVKAFLKRDTDFQVVAEGICVSDIPGIYEKSRPDIILMDFKPEDTLDMKVTRKLIADIPESKIIILTNHEEEAFVTHWLLAGAYGYLHKNVDTQTVTRAIHAVVEGGMYINSTTTDYILNHYRRLAEREQTAKFQQKKVLTPLHLLTKRECELLQLLADGNGTRVIAKISSISEVTVKNHISSIIRKMNVQDRVNAVVTAIKNGWVEVGSV